VVPFSPLGIFFALGLRIVSENVNFVEDDESHTKCLIKGKEICSVCIFQQLTVLCNNDNVDDFYKLCILIGFAKFHFPKTTDNVHDSLLRLLHGVFSFMDFGW